MDLPDHPYLACCRFFRYAGQEVIIFTDYVEGGTLAAWIESGKLNRLEQILDVAIQFAWGLHIAHECGVIHQDIKPQNVLMTPDGQVKITDFGIARRPTSEWKVEWKFTGGPLSEEEGRSILPHAAGRTKGYMSPEQAGAQPISRKTDIWSWGVSILDMLIGKTPSCTSGTIAAHVLRAYCASAPAGKEIPKMPPELVEILQRCFLLNPADRWADMAEVVKALCRVYKQATAGTEYPRLLQMPPSRPLRSFVDDECGWRHSSEWLAGVVAASKQSSLSSWAQKEVKDIFQDLPVATRPVALGSRRGQGTAHLVIYSEVERIYQELVSVPNSDALTRLAALLYEKGSLYVWLNDETGALTSYSKSVSLLEQLVYREGQTQLTPDLARAYLNKAASFANLGKHAAAIQHYDQSIAVYEPLVYQGQQFSLCQEFVRCLGAKATVMVNCGDREGVIKTFEKAISSWHSQSRARPSPGMNQCGNLLMRACCDAWNALAAMRDNKDRKVFMERYGKLFDLATFVWDRLSPNDADQQTQLEAVQVSLMRGDGLRKQGHFRAAGAHVNRAIGILERLLRNRDEQELCHELAKAYMSMGVITEALGDKTKAVELLDKASALCERLNENYGDDADDGLLVIAGMARGFVATGADDNEAAREVCRKFIAMLEEILGNDDGDPEGQVTRNMLAVAKACWACLWAED